MIQRNRCWRGNRTTSDAICTRQCEELLRTSAGRSQPHRCWALFTLMLWAGLASIGWPSEPASRPNILFVLTDDQAPTATGHTGHPHLRTPNIDRLFQEGAELRNSFVTTPVCSPSRAGLMTSRYSTELGILDWIHPRRESQLGLDPKWVTWPTLLSNAGYTTGLVGKWHLGTADRFHPTQMGYQYFMGFREGGTRPENPTLEVDGKPTEFDGLTTDILTDHAIGFVRRNRSGPFALSLHYRAPHSPWLPVAEEDWQPYSKLDPQLPDPEIPHLDTKKLKRMTREYLASVTSIDRNMGRLLSVLDELDIAGNTVVIFTSDHGYNLGHHGIWYKGNAQWQLTKLPPQRWPGIPPRQRPNLYDQSLRVPTAIRWPGTVPPGTVIEHTITNLDWYPTLLAIAEVPQPSHTIRGRDFCSLLRGRDIPWDNDIYCEYSMRHGATTDMRAYRTPQWKLMIDLHNTGREELYDLAADPAEQSNLSSSEDPRVVRAKDRLREKLRASMVALGGAS